MSKERPILFNAEMVQAILAGRKTQTRRLIEPQPPINRVMIFDEGEAPPFRVCMDDQLEKFPGPYEWKTWTCPYGQPGDRLWVRETWAAVFRNEGSGHYLQWRDTPREQRTEANCEGKPIYRADGGHDRDWEGCWAPSIFMPRWASRISLEVTDVRVERVQSIDEADAIAEGVESEQAAWGGKHWRDYRGEPGAWFLGPRQSFGTLWDSIYAKRGYEWYANPWVWVLQFQVI